MEVGDVVRLIRDIPAHAGRVIPAGTCGTIRQKAATGLIVEFCTDDPEAIVSVAVTAEEVEFRWRDPDNPLIRPGADLQPWLPHLRRKISARKSKKAP